MSTGIFKVLCACLLFALAGIPAWGVVSGEPVKEEVKNRVGVGSSSPAFVATTTQGSLAFPGDQKGKWVILLTYPSDFSPVGATELLTLAAMVPEFKALNCDLLAMSQDNLASHIAWLRSIQEKLVYKNMKGVNVNFPLIADANGEIARAYGLPSGQESRSSSSLVIMDPKVKIRAILGYPSTIGRNFMEIKRLLVALQTADAYGIETPSDWQPGEDVIVPAPATMGTARERLSNGNGEVYSPEWYLSLKKLSRDSIPPAPIKKA